MKRIIKKEENKELTSVCSRVVSAKSCHSFFCSSICSVEKKRKNVEAIEGGQSLTGSHLFGFLYKLLPLMTGDK